MHRPSRLTALLRSFQLVPGATSAELRQAYLREAKRLHPDSGVAREGANASQDFAELRNRYEEAQALLAGAPTIPPQPEPRPWAHGGAGGAYHGPDEVPTFGLPARAVHTAFAFLAVGVAGAWALRRDKGPVSDKESIVQPSRGIPASQSMRAPPEAAVSDAREEFRDASEYFRSLSQHRKTKSDKPLRQSKKGMVKSQLRDGVALSAMQAAAADGSIWFLERCGASRVCRTALDHGDRRGDRPLHYCARHGQALACRTLLRMGAEPRVQNKWGLTPTDLAAHNGHSEVSSLLRAATRSADDPAFRTWHADRLRHPDGLGLLCRLPERTYYNGPYPSEVLRNAANYAVGKVAIGALNLAVESQDDIDAVSVSKLEFAVGRVRSSLQGSGFEVEPTQMPPDALRCGGNCWLPRYDCAEVVGLLFFEPPGQVTADAPGHFFAVRRSPALTQGGDTAATSGANASFFRLDPVRGPYRLSAIEFEELIGRYGAWRVLRKASGLREWLFGDMKDPGRTPESPQDASL